MDRSVLESDPHRVLEGMAIAAYAVGASKGYIYVRAEYPLAVARLTNGHSAGAAVAACSGNNICGTPFNFDVEIRLGCGSICLRRRNSSDRIHRRPARDAATPAALSRGQRPMGQAHADQQRGDLRQYRADHPQWRRMVRRDRARSKSKGTKVFALTGQDQQHRAD